MRREFSLDLPYLNSNVIKIENQIWLFIFISKDGRELFLRVRPSHMSCPWLNNSKSSCPFTENVINHSLHPIWRLRNVTVWRETHTCSTIISSLARSPQWMVHRWFGVMRPFWSRDQGEAHHMRLSFLLLWRTLPALSCNYLPPPRSFTPCNVLNERK